MENSNVELTGTVYELETVKLAYESIKQNLQYHSQTILDLTKDKDIRDGNLAPALLKITEVLAKTVDVKRASIWEYSAIKNTIYCLDLYEMEFDKHSSGVELHREHFPNYFEAMENESVIVANNAHTHYNTNQFTEVYLKPLNIYSLLDVPYYVEGKLGGVICFEHQGYFRDWTFQDIAFTTSVCAIISVAIQSMHRKEAELQVRQANEELRQLTEEIAAQRDSILEKNLILEEKELKISQSIEAAKFIQEAILPYKAKLDNLLQKYFIINLPRDIVSGDFYWLNEINGKTILAVIDCTGHGVPGAFMTMIGNTLMDKIVRVWDKTSPSEILETLHLEVGTVLNTSHTANSSGMDVGIVTFTKTEKGADLVFSGAKLNLVHTVKNSKEVAVIKGQRRPIAGLGETNKPFFNTEFQLTKGDRFYLTTDGFIDQQDTNRTRLGKKGFAQIVLEMQNFPFSEHEKGILKELKTYMVGTDQRDDILIVGVEI